MPQEPVREPLYERIARLVRSRNSIVLLLGLFIVGRIALTATRAGTGQSALKVGLAAAGLILMLVVGVLVSRSHRQAGRDARVHAFSVLWPPTGWSLLDDALDSYRIRTGVLAPAVGIVPSEAVGDRVDAELVFLPATSGDGSVGVISPIEAGPGDVPVVVFTQAMLASYSAPELLAVLVHLVQRIELSRGATAGSSNGVCEADSKTLLLTHDHVALLNAIQKASTDRETLPPSMGLVKFADADMYTRNVTATGTGLSWEKRDRLAALRTHLGAAALDVPESAG